MKRILIVLVWGLIVEVRPRGNRLLQGRRQAWLLPHLRRRPLHYLEAGKGLAHGTA